MRFIQFILIMVVTLVLNSCSSGGSCGSCSTGQPQVVSLIITSPIEYPAGIPVTAYLTITNISNSNLSGLVYSVPPPGGTSSGNTTGVTIDVSNGEVACSHIPAHTSCVFTAVIPKSGTTPTISTPGSFTVTAKGNASGSGLIFYQQFKSLIGIKSDLSANATANLGLASIPADVSTQLYILPNSQTIIPNSGESTLVWFSLVVESATPAFNAIKLYDNGVAVTAVSESPTPNGSNYTSNDVVTLSFYLPPGVSGIESITAVAESNGSSVCGSNCSNTAYINIAESGSGILSIIPTYVTLTGDYESQIYTMTNTGQATISNITLPVESSPLSIVDNKCTTSGSGSGILAVGASCTFILAYAVESASGLVTLTTTYSNGVGGSPSTSVQAAYIGNPAPTVSSVTPESGASGVSSSANVSVTFSIPMNESTLIPANFELFDSTASVFESLLSPIYSTDGTTVSFSIPYPLTANDVYQIIVPTPANIQSAASVALSTGGVISTFTVNNWGGGGCYAYMLNNANNSITQCIYNNDGGFSSCQGNGVATTGVTLDNPSALQYDTQGNGIFVTNLGNSTLSLVAAGAVTGYTAVPPYSAATSASGLSTPTGMTEDNMGNVYIATSGGTLTVCPNGTSCAVNTPASYPATASALGLAVESTADDYLVFTLNTSANSISVCNVSAAIPCIDAGGSGFSSPTGISVNLLNIAPSPGYALITNSGNNTVLRCDASSPTGALSNCVATGSEFNQPSAVSEFLSGPPDYAYITNSGDNTVTVCSDNQGVLTNCNRMAYGFSNPVGIIVLQNCGI